MAKESDGSVEGLKRRLYRRDAPQESPEERTPLMHNEVHPPKSWNEIPPQDASGGDMPPAAPADQTPPPSLMPRAPKKRMSLATKFFLGSVLFFVLATGVAATLFFKGINTTSPQNIDVEVDMPSLIDGGKPTTFEIIVTNRNTTDLELADLNIDYPAGARSAADPTQSLTHDQISIGTIKSGQQIKKTLSAVFYGQEGTQESLAARLEYSVSGSNAVFEKDGQADFTIGSAPVSLSVSMPSQVVAGTQFSMDVTVRSNAAAAVNNVVVSASYPFGFTLAGSQPAATAGGIFWRLGTMQPGAAQTIHLTGSIDASDGDQRVFRFSVGSNTDPTDTVVDVPFLTLPQSVTVEQPFVSGSISVNGKTGQSIVVSSGQSLQGEVDWQNNLSDSISDLELDLSFSGPSVDRNSISSGSGFYQSSNTTIIWSKDQNPSLASVAPGAMGSFPFSFATLPPAAQNTLITNPTITLNLTVHAVRQGDGSAPSDISSAATAKLVLASELTLAAQSMRATGPFINTGPTPPRAEQGTSYTIGLTLKNSANSLANTSVKTTLPSYVNFITATPSSGITYDSGSRTVTWPVGDLKAGVGYTDSADQAYFQVMIIPSASQVGSAPALTGPITVTGLDRYAQVQVQASANPPTTAASDIGSGMDTVQAKQ